jgi:transcriptional regulator with XRE-family HTH domain
MATNLKTIRESVLNVTQEAVARRTNLSFSAYRNAETGKRVTYGTATEILSAINAMLQEQSKNQVTLEDLGLRIY